METDNAANDVINVTDNKYEDMYAVHNAFKKIFGEKVTIISKRIKKGAGCSSNIYVPNKFSGKAVTLIIWED